MDVKKIVAIAATVLIVLVILGRVVSNSSANRLAAGAASPTNQLLVDKWRVTESRSPMDDSKTVVLTLDSDDVFQGPVGSSKPTLVVRCKEGKTEVYVETGMAASIEQDLDGGPEQSHAVRIRLDDSSPTSEDWLESNDHKALFASDLILDPKGDIASYTGGAAEFAKQLAGAGKLTFEFTPFDGNPQTARFNLLGLRDHLNQAADACSWHID